MCGVIRWNSPSCKHRWITIIKPCAPDRGFNNCPGFEKGRASRDRTVVTLEALPKTCPVCDMEDDYDGNTTRVIKKEARGARMGAKPGKGPHGLEMVCCSVM